jgi:hypothetical protein
MTGYAMCHAFGFMDAGRATAQLDLLFVPKDSALRADRRWAG